ncbi:Asx homology domain-containing protein [Kalaharituber pfeilii]|nr:Asx homology domain-containing protein [Kalaharituber pfeilii]
MELRKRTRTPSAKALENRNAVAESTGSQKTRNRRRKEPEQDDNSSAVKGKKRRPGKVEVNLNTDTVTENDQTEGSESKSATDGSKEGGLNEEISPRHGSPNDEERHDKETGRGKRRKVNKSTQSTAAEKDGITLKTLSNIPGDYIEEERKVDSGMVQAEEEKDQLPDGEVVSQGESEGSERKEPGTDIGASHRVEIFQQASDPQPSRSLNVKLPDRMVQQNKRKDMDDGERGGGQQSKTLPEELTTPKRPKRLSNEDRTKDNTTLSSTPSTLHHGNTTVNRGSTKKVEVIVPSTPSYATRKRGRINYEEPPDSIYDEDEGLSASIPHRGKSSPPKSSNRKNATKFTPIEHQAVDDSTPKARKGRKSQWDKDVLLTSKNSKLVKARDLSDVLNSATWDLLSPGEKKECLDLLPTIDKIFVPSSNTDADPNGEPALVADFFESNQVFKDSLIEFQDDLSNGRYEPTYVAQAASARKARLEGAADKYKDGQYELYWGQRQRTGMVAGAAAQIKLPELVQKGLLKAGDIWAFRRKFCIENSKRDIIIEKEVKVADVTVNEGKYSLVFHIPPGPHKFSHPSREDIVLEGVVSPQAVETLILKTHPKTPSYIPNGNAFKVFNVWRKGEDLGMLWEIRQTYWGGE